MKKILLLIFMLTGAYGCATAPVERALPATTAKSILSSEVYVIVNNDDIEAPTSKSTGGSDYGILGLIVDSALDNAAHNKMVRALEPINNSAKNFDFKKSVIERLKKSHIFIHQDQIHILKNMPTTEEKSDIIKSAGSRPVVFLNFSRILTADYTTLLVGSTLSVDQENSNSDKYSISTIYQSKTMEGGKAIENWSAHEGQEYKNELSDGIGAVVDMLKIAIIEHPSNLPKPNDKTCEFYKISSGYIPQLSTAKLIKSNGARCEALVPSGEYISALQVYKFKNSKIPSLAHNKGRVFLYNLQDRNMFSPSIYEDSKDIGVLGANKILYVDVKPGKHIFTSKLIDDRPGTSLAKDFIGRLNPIKINVESGKTYYVRYIGFKGIFTSADDIKLTNKDTATKEMQNMIVAK